MNGDAVVVARNLIGNFSSCQIVSQHVAEKLTQGAEHVSSLTILGIDIGR